MTFDLQTILVQDQTFHFSNHAQEVTQLLALEIQVLVELNQLMNHFEDNIYFLILF
jgi:hypothetical protein